MATNPQKSATAPETKALEQTPTQNDSESQTHTESEQTKDAEHQASANADTKLEAAKKNARHYRKMKYQQIAFWVIALGVPCFIVATALNGTLMKMKLEDRLTSMVWLFPLFLLTAPIVYFVIRYARVEDAITRLGMSAIAVVITIISFVLTIEIGFGDEFWSSMIGNETYGTLGLIGALGILGTIAGFLLGVVLPAAMYIYLYVLLIRKNLSVLKVLIFAALTPWCFMLPIGLSIVVNSGF